MSILSTFTPKISQIAQADFGGGFVAPSDSYTTRAKAGEGFSGAVTAVKNLEAVLSNIIGFLTILAGLFFVFHFVIGAFNWIGAAGEKGKVEKSREKMTQATVGLVVIIASYAMIGLIGTILGLDILRPGRQILLQLNPIKTITPASSFGLPPG